MALDSIDIYRLEVSETGPWTDYYVIIKNDREKFKVPYGKAFPFVIHDNELFIPDRFNIANTETAEKAKYGRYRLGKQSGEPLAAANKMYVPLRGEV